MNARLALAATLLVILPAAPARTAVASRAGHCAAATVTPVPGEPGAFRIVTANGATTSRYPGRTGTVAPNYTIRGYDQVWDADLNLATLVDTLVVPVGATVRWHLVSGVHTVTSGAGPRVLDAGSKFDVLLDETHPDFDSTFTAPDTVDFFCYFHEPLMVGRVIVSANLEVPGGGLPTKLAFTRGPMPNPSSGVVAFAIAVPRAAPVTAEVMDLAGRRVATVLHDTLTPGEHLLRWRGVDDRGNAVAAGSYLVRVRMGGSAITRRFSLLR